MIKFIRNLFKGIKQKCNIPVVSNSVICDCCNDYGYIDVLFGQNGKYDSQIICPKCNGKSKFNSQYEDLKTGC